MRVRKTGRRAQKGDQPEVGRLLVRWRLKASLQEESSPGPAPTQPKQGGWGDLSSDNNDDGPYVLIQN